MSATVRRSMDLIDRVADVVGAHGREDLVDRLRTTRRRLEDPAIRVLFVGEYKKGKSQLVNAIVNANVCRVDADVATAIPTALRWAEEPVALIHPISSDADDGRTAPTRVPLEEFHTYLSEGRDRGIRLAEAGLPRPVLEGGLVLVDTPGVGGLSSAHGAATAAALPMADAVVFVTDASQELTEPEIEFLNAAHEICPNIVCVLTKIDIYPEWRRILDINRERLARAGVRIGLGAVSSALRMHALRTGDAKADDESGIPTLITFLRDRVVASAERISLRSAAHDITWSVGRLETALASERSLLADPKRSGTLVNELQQAKERATKLRDQASRWQQLLNDGITDLSSDVDHDLRARFRDVTRVAEEAIDKADPSDLWDEFEPWLYRRMNAEISQNYAGMMSSVEELARRIADVFEVDAPLLDPLDFEAPLESIASTPIALDPKSAKKPGIGEQGLTLLRGAYSTTLMFSLIGGVVGVGLTITNPLLLGAGAAMGVKTLRDQRSRDREQRRQKAKMAVRKFVDDVSFQVIKDKTDRLRLLHRELRDGFAARAAELQRSAGDALAVAQRSVESDEQKRSKRLRELDETLKTIASMRSDAAALVAQPKTQVRA